MTQFYTYLHCKPDLTPFYVGKGHDSIHNGRRSHNFKNRSNHHKRIVAKYGEENIIVMVFKKDSEESALKSEIRLIKMLRNAGFKLANYTDGGEGVMMKPSIETRKKISQSLTGYTHTFEARTKMSIAQKGNKKSVGRPCAPETRARISASCKGRPATKGNTGNKYAHKLLG